MNIPFLKSLLLPIVENKDMFHIDIKPADDVFCTEVRIRVSLDDMRKVIGHRGKTYRSIKIIIKYALRQEAVNVIIDLWDKK